MSTPQTSLKSKLSLKTIMGSVNIPKLHEEGAKDLFNVGGTALGVKHGNSNFGEWHAFQGQFAAIKLETGEIYRGGQLFLPRIAEDYVKPVVEAAAGAPVEFAFIIGVEPATKPNGEKSYQYTVKPIVDAASVDPLADMLAKLEKHTPAALASPGAEKTAEKAADGTVPKAEAENKPSEATANGDATKASESKAGAASGDSVKPEVAKNNAANSESKHAESTDAHKHGGATHTGKAAGKPSDKVK